MVALKFMEKFNNLGSSVSSSKNHNNKLLTKAATAINRLSIIWKSNLSVKISRIFFYCGCVDKTIWMLTKRIEKKLDDNCTRMLWVIWNKSRKQYFTKQQLHGHLPPISKTIQIRQTAHTGQYWRSKDKLISDVLQWISSHGRANVGRQTKTYL